MHQASEGGSEREPGPGPKAAAASQDRRSYPRYTVLDHRGWLTWWDERGLEVDDIRLLDISRGGAAFEVKGLLPEGQAVLLGLQQLREASCVEATVVRVTGGQRLRYRVHVAFTESCPDEFFESAIYHALGSASDPVRRSSDLPMTLSANCGRPGEQARRRGPAEPIRERP